MVREPGAALVHGLLQAVSGELERALLEPVQALVDAGGNAVAHHRNTRSELGGDQGEGADHRGDDTDDDGEGRERARDPLGHTIHQGPEHGGQQYRNGDGADDQCELSDPLADEPQAGRDEQQARRPARGETDRVRQMVTRDPYRILSVHEEQFKRSARDVTPDADAPCSGPASG